MGRIRFGADRAMGILGKEGMVRKRIFQICFSKFLSPSSQFDVIFILFFSCVLV